MADTAAVHTLAAQAFERLGKFDVVICDAGSVDTANRRARCHCLPRRGFVL